MFNHVQLRLHWMHVLNSRICRYTCIIPTVQIIPCCDQDRCVNEVVQPWTGTLLCSFRVFLTKFGHKLLLFYIFAHPDFMSKSGKK